MTFSQLALGELFRPIDRPYQGYWIKIRSVFLHGSIVNAQHVLNAKLYTYVDPNQPVIRQKI